MFIFMLKALLSVIFWLCFFELVFYFYYSLKSDYNEIKKELKDKELKK